MEISCMGSRVFNFGINVETLCPRMVFKPIDENRVGDIPVAEVRSKEGVRGGMKGRRYSGICPDCACCIMMTERTAPLKR